MTANEFADALKRLDLTQAKAGAILGYRQAHISDMARGLTPIKTPTAIAIRAMLAFGHPDSWPAM